MSKQFIFFVATIKAITSLIYGHLSLQNNWGDTYSFFYAGEIMSKLFYKNPLKYFKLLTTKSMNPLSSEYIQIFGVEKIPYGSLSRSGFISRIHSLLHLISDGFYPTHAVIFSFLSLIGLFYICLTFYRISPKTVFLSKFFVYFTPSILFWTSGAHKDALITFGLGMMLYSFYNCFIEKNVRYFVGFLLACGFSYLARNYTFFLFLPGLVTFYFAYLLKERISPFWTYSICMILGLLAFFFFPFISPKLDFMARFVSVQEHFLSLNGKSNFYMEPLEPKFEVFIKAFPEALWNSISLPNFSYNEFYLAKYAALENFLLLFLAVVSLKFINIKKINNQELNAALFCFGYGFFFYTLLGLTVANVGALVRYKSVGLIFIQFGFIFLINTQSLFNFINKISPFKKINYGSR